MRGRQTAKLNHFRIADDPGGGRQFTSPFCVGEKLPR